MSNRTLTFLTALVIVAMVALFALNVTSILTGQPANQTYIRYDEVQGMAIEHNKLLYTLNFEQQNEIITILNSGAAVREIRAGERVHPGIQKLIIYPLEGKPEITLIPIAYINQDLILSAAEWVPNGYLMELSEGKLKNLLAKTYD